MIEYSCLHNGGTDLPITASPDDKNITYTTSNMDAVHRSFQRVAGQQIDQAVLAEELGFHYFWLTEHHFQPEGAEFSPNPLQTGAAIAMRTSEIRIGQMANILHRHHPLRVAEQAGLLDVISGGRLEFGVGRGGGTRETEPFGQVYGSSDVDQYRSHAYFAEAMEIILKAWTEPSFSYHGDFYSIPPKWLPWQSRITDGYFSQPGLERTLDDIVEMRDGQGYLKELSVYPHPLQKPYPQIWQTALSTNSVRSAARHGYNVCHLGAGGDQVREAIEAYHEESEKAGWPDRHHKGAFRKGWDSERKRGISFLRFVHVGDITPERRAGLYHFPNYIAESLISGVHLPHGVRFTGDFFEQNGLMLHGSRQQVIDGLMADYESGFEDYLVLPIFETPGLTGKEIEEQMRIFAEDIMPVLNRECGGSAPLEPLLEVPSN